MLTAAVSGAALLTTLGAAPADAAAVPTVAVTASGNTDWTITFDQGRSTTPECDVRVGHRRVATQTTDRTMTIAGDGVRPGRHAVTVRCGNRVSPTIWLYAPRGQINDIGTWASNTSAGALGI